MHTQPLPFDAFASRKERIAVVGLGYVGLPLAVALAKHFSVIGFDVAAARIEELRQGKDRTGEVSEADIAASTITFSCNPADLSAARLVIVAVPTPIDSHRSPDLGPVKSASTAVGENLSPGTVVVYESTVYPGVTEEVCVPILEERSGLRCTFSAEGACGAEHAAGHGTFFVGYSPERINPGDKVHTVDRIVKVVAGGTPETADLLAAVYGAVTTAGIHKASSIKVAEAAKVIENTQRDLNIALMNELSLIFDRLGIDTLEVLEAAGTKWNFLPFRPGLVGGHCIGVDPYYLTYKAEEAGYHPEVILAGRRINDGMGRYIAQKAVKMLIAAKCRVDGARIGVFGLTFKENVPDLRNTRVVDILQELSEFGVQALVHDPVADCGEARHEYELTLSSMQEMHDLDAVIVAVGHDAYKDMGLQAFKALCAKSGPTPFLDVKGIWSDNEARAAGFAHWRL